MTYIQDSLFDGQTRKELGQQSVLRNQADWWKEEALAVIIRFVATHDQMTSDDLRELIGSPENSNSWGAIFSCASKQKIIKKTGKYVASKIPSCHGRMIAVWARY